MNTNYRYIFYTACLAALFSCTRFEEDAPQLEEVEKVQMTFTATISDEAETKTVLDGRLGDGLRKVLWTPEDVIGVANAEDIGYPVEKFVNTGTEDSETGTFEGGIALARNYCAIYPYEGSGVTSYDNGGTTVYAMIFRIPQIQKYAAGSFGKDCAPMVAKAAHGEAFEFRNLCGLLALNLTGKESVKSITFSGTDASGRFKYVSGKFLVEMNYTDAPSIIAGPESPLTAESLQASKSVTLECDEPVRLNENEATPFYFVLPPGTYESFIITITTDDGKTMMKQGTKPLTIKRSDVQPTADLAYIETTSVNLSINGFANCYIVPSSGIYSFNATTIGNGDFGLIPDAGFHTDNTTISPVSAELLWCDNEGAITGVSYSNGKISFLATGAEGNAVIAAKDADGTILWSWHIWMTDRPAEQIYVNSTGEHTVLDRNLGATRADRGTGEEWKDAQGLAYQWGRKDPFAGYQYGVNYDGIVPDVTYKAYSSQASISETIASPDTFYYGSDHWHNGWNISLWSDTKKTIYDPCPQGYMVAYSDVWRSFTTTEEDVYNESSLYNTIGAFENGWDFLYDGVNSTYYPVTWSISYWGGTDRGNTSYCDIWSSQKYEDIYRHPVFRYYYGYEYDHQVLKDDHLENYVYGHMVRCVKETNTITPALNEVTNITSSSAKFSGKVSASSSNDILMKGFVYGNSADVTIENGTVIQCGSGSGTFTANATGLTEGLYYVKTYAVTTSGTYYSPATYFIAKDSVNDSEKAMIFTVSANFTNNFVVQLPTWGTIQCTVEWGDGTVETYDTYDSNLTHTYAISEPTYFDVKISGTVTGLYDNNYDNRSITEVKQWGLTGLTSMSNAFAGENMLTGLCDDTLGSFIDVTSFRYAWSGCNTLTEIPENLFRYAIKATDFVGAFQNSGITELKAGMFMNCSSAQNFGNLFMQCQSLTTIDPDLFAGCTSVTDLGQAFYNCTNLVTIPSGLFKDCVNVKSIYNMFGDCTSLVSIPAGLFDYFNEVENFSHCFNRCHALTEIPSDLFRYNSNAKDFSWIFSECSSLQTIPAELFNNLTNATTFHNAFNSCINLTAIPAGLFRNCSNVEDFSSTFWNCNQLVSIAGDIFENCTKANNFSDTFSNCHSLAALPESLFASCTNAKNFNSTFYYCQSLTSIPANLFESNMNAESFQSTFSHCIGLTSIPANLFDMTRRVKSFYECFYRCNNITGESPYTIINGVKYHLYERVNNAQQFLAPESTYSCFYNCTGLSDYDSIPGEWK